MKLKINNLIFNTETCSHTRKIRITREELSSRSYVVKTEQLCHQIHNKEHYFLIVVLEKYTDNQLTSTYSWLQYVSQEELQEFLALPDYYKPRKPRKPKEPSKPIEPKQPKEPRKPKEPKPPKEPSKPIEPNEPKEPTFARKEWEELHKQQLKEYRHQYYELHKEELKKRAKEQSRKYYNEHKDKWQQYYLNKKEK